MNTLYKHSKAEKLFFDKENIRWATPEIVADYRAKRLKCSILADLCCGIGFQAIAFAKQCKKVYAVEKDEKKLELAKKNAEALGIKNITFIEGDVLDKKIITKVKDAEIFFCDPERPETEEERRISSIKPNVKDLLKNYKDIAIEFPPQIKELPENCEKEYISVNGKLNRLTLYFGKLKKNEVKVISLPSEEFIAGNRGSYKTSPLKKFLYETDTAAEKAGLLNELAEKTGAKVFTELFLTSEKLIKSVFFRNTFEIFEEMEFDENKIIEYLRKNNAGKVVIRYNISPEDYWSERKKYERKLTGKEEFYLFKFNKAVIAKKLTGLQLH